MKTFQRLATSEMIRERLSIRQLLCSADKWKIRQSRLSKNQDRPNVATQPPLIPIEATYSGLSQIVSSSIDDLGFSLIKLGKKLTTTQIRRT